LNQAIHDFLAENHLDLIEYQVQPTEYDDSTHQIITLTCQQGQFHLKQLRSNHLGIFWQGMRAMFNFDIRQETLRAKQKYDFINEHSSLQTPDFVAATENLILVHTIKGKTIDSPFLQCDIEGLAHHLSELHKPKSKFFGSLLNPCHKAEHWQTKVSSTIKSLAMISNISINAPESPIICNEFCPVMMDLRVDQFMRNENQEMVVLDLDAYVFADKRLEFVMLEYLLSPKELNVFCEYYPQKIPSLADVRKPYRDLLFLMNSLGETDLFKWQSHPTYFD